jgi:hypothetical protein
VTACGGGNTGPASESRTAPGDERSSRTAALETAADALQSKGPVSTISMYLNGFHLAKSDPKMQMEAHHYCNQVNQDFAQCVLYDGNTADARLMGVEYIVSETVYETLPEQEKAFWHPHNFEILSGQLRMPGVPEAAEKAALADKINSYGKTWHTWMTGVHGGTSDQLPLGPAQLQWSFNRDGEALPGMVEARDERMGLDTTEARAGRADLASRANPQGGVCSGRPAAEREAAHRRRARQRRHRHQGGADVRDEGRGGQACRAIGVHLPGDRPPDLVTA